MAKNTLPTYNNHMQVSLYIHFPFCLKKCLYCDFDSVAGAMVTPEEYVSAVVREIELRAATLATPVTAATLYFGGGTPSLMSPDLVGRVIDSAARLYGLSTDAEVTIEANPGTLTAEKLQGFRMAGVNRLSLGVQSLDDALLRRIGRIHTAREAQNAYRSARAAGFDNIGIDLMHSLPGQTPAMWRSALNEAIGLDPEHISAYALSVEEGTPFASLEESGQLILPNEDDAIAMFEATTELLTAGSYEQYEISNFSRPGFRSRHNQIYWRRGNYLGFGAGAHSFLREPASGLRWVNPRLHSSYLDLIGQGGLGQEERQLLSLQEALGETFFLGLRLLDGVNLAEVEAEFGAAMADHFSAAISELMGQGC